MHPVTGFTIGVGIFLVPIINQMHRKGANSEDKNDAREKNTD